MSQSINNLRLQRLRNALQEESLDAVFISSLPNIAYLTGFNGFSKEDRDAFLLINQKKQYIFTHGIYAEVVKKQISSFEFIAIKREQPISKSVKDLCQSEKIARIGFESYDLTVLEFQRLRSGFEKNPFKSTDCVTDLRVIKSPEEIDLLAKACTLGDQIFKEICKEIIEGITEKQIAAILDYKVAFANAETSFPTIIAFGENAAHPHHQPTDAKLIKNTFVLIDFGVRVKNYISDMTRTVFFGKANQQQKNAYQAVLEAQKKAQAYIEAQLKNKKAVSAQKADHIARQSLIERGYPQMPHSLGHGVGIEVHESPRLTPSSQEELSEGMAFSIEPGMYLPGEMGIRIEDLYAIVDGKLKPLTHASRNFTEI